MGHIIVTLQEILINMFSKDTYTSRRQELKKLVGEGIILLFGNNEAPANYPANAYAPMRQDSSFLYYFGQHRDGLVGVIDIDNDRETLIGDDIDIEDIVWYGSVDAVADLAAQVGVAHWAPMKELQHICNEALRLKRPIHFLPPYRFDTKIQIMDLLNIHPSQQKESASQSANRPASNDASLGAPCMISPCCEKMVAKLTPCPNERAMPSTCPPTNRSVTPGLMSSWAVVCMA